MPRRELSLATFALALSSVTARADSEKPVVEERDGGLFASSGILVSKTRSSDTTIEVEVELVGGVADGWVSTGWRAGGDELLKPSRAYASGFLWRGTITSGKYYLACDGGTMCRLSNIKIRPRK